MDVINCRRKNSSSGDKFSFPVIIQDSDEFEFGSVRSPASPADHLFSNGKLLPHAFPIHTSSNYLSYSRSASRTSSKDSLMSSRSNSTNSRSSTSTCSSARTSTSEVSERRLIKERSTVRSPAPAVPSFQYQYGSSRRWQLIAAVPVPALKHQGSRSSRKVDTSSVLDRKGSKKSRGVEESRGSKSWFGRKILKSFVDTCKECHAITT